VDNRLRPLMLLPAAAILGLAVLLPAGELPEDELQAAFNGYFDNFRVRILYPTFSITKKISPAVSITGRYVVDAITAASMQNRFAIDGVTSATTRWTPSGVPASSAPVDGVTSASTPNSGGGESEDGFDEVRHEFNAGIIRLIGDGTLSLNGLFSTENDYRSWTAAAQISWPFAMNNTVVQIGGVRSWDRIFPDTRTWTRSKDVETASAGLTQVLSERWIVQANASWTRMSGFLSDPYQPVPIFGADGSFRYHETVLPGVRVRKAAGLRSNWMWSDRSSLQAGYRRYWDDWGVRSNTFHALVQRMFAEKNITIGMGYRRYDQNRASFIKTEYSGDEPYRTVDTKLGDLWSNEWEASASIRGAFFAENGPLSAFRNERVEYRGSIGFYQRRSALPDWYNRYVHLYSAVVSLGIKVRL
jgi:hypothetical protein